MKPKFWKKRAQEGLSQVLHEMFLLMDTEDLPRICTVPLNPKMRDPFLVRVVVVERVLSYFGPCDPFLVDDAAPFGSSVVLKLELYDIGIMFY